MMIDDNSGELQRCLNIAKDPFQNIKVINEPALVFLISFYVISPS